MTTCAFEGCTRERTGQKRYCAAHMQQLRRGRELTPLLGAHGAYRKPETVHRDNWAPPAGLSPDWHANAAVKRARTMPEPPRADKCAKSGCGGYAARGSTMCEAHDHWEKAQAKLRARLRA